MENTWMLLAVRQAGVISTAQLHERGVSKYHVAHLVADGRIERVRPGTFRVAGWDGGAEQALWLALLDAGQAAFLRGRSAGVRWGFDGIAAPPGEPVQLGVPLGRHTRGAPTARVTLRAGDLSRAGGLPVTSAARTLIDLAALEPDGVVERAVESALRTGATSVSAVEERLAAGRLPGSATLRRVLSHRPPGCKPTESDAETLFVILARSAGLPPPVRQFGLRAGGRHLRLDCAWPEVRLAVEIDGEASHGPGRFDYDLWRQNAIVLEGWTVLRFSWRRLVADPRRVRYELLRGWQAQSALFR